ncbi:MAG: hypothetical protein MJ171_01405 [Clostridia bacterium]|nr:hypothetical protein [Clostridia bacterium]
MAEEKKITRADGTSAKTKEERKGAAMPKRILAIVFWVLGIVCEALAICVLNKYFYVSDQLLWLIIFIVADLIMVIIGSQFWKKANDIDPASKANKVKYFLQNQMGLIVSIIAFFPLIVLLLKNKDLDPKTKKIVTIVAACALLVCSLASIDWNPASEEDLLSAQGQYGTSDVYWTRFGKSYHLDTECQSLTRSKELIAGTVEEAFAANRHDPCDFCVPQN